MDREGWLYKKAKLDGVVNNWICTVGSHPGKEACKCLCINKCMHDSVNVQLF